MLNKSELKTQIQDGIEKFLKPALEGGFKSTFPNESEIGDETAQTFAETTVEIFAEPFATHLADCIDYYVKSISISGTIITTGSPATQQAMIKSPKYVTNGKVPNSLGIS